MPRIFFYFRSYCVLSPSYTLLVFFLFDIYRVYPVGFQYTIWTKINESTAIECHRYTYNVMFLCICNCCSNVECNSNEEGRNVRNVWNVCPRFNLYIYIYIRERERERERLYVIRDLLRRYGFISLSAFYIPWAESEEDIEHRQGIWTRIPCEARIRIIFC